MTVKFAYPPPLDQIRAAMAHSQKIKGEVSVQNFTGSGAENEVEIGTEAQEEGQLNVNRQDMQDVLNARWGQTAGKLDFNNTSQQVLAERLRDPLARAGVAMSEPQLQKLVARHARFPRYPAALRPGHKFSDNCPPFRA